jgi:hypothetical protein
MKTAEVSVHLQIHDVAALIHAARERAIADGLAGDMITAMEIIEDDDISLALRMFIDPGQPPAGTEILDSSCEING